MAKYLFTIIFFFNFIPLFGDEIYLNDGSVVRGKITKITPTAVEYKPEGPKVFDLFPRGQIKKIVFDNGTVIELNETNMAGSGKTKINGKSEVAGDEKSGAERHDGFYFRLALGYGFGETKVSDFGGSDITYSGPGGLFSTDIGYAVVDNFILFLTRSGAAIAASEVAYNKKKDKSSGNNVGFTNTGIGFTAYVMPSNFFISASVYDVYQTFKGDYIKGNTKSGYGFLLSLGKEWWFSENWGIGFSMFGYYSKTKAKSDYSSTDYNIKNQMYGLSVTATYN